MGAGADDLEAAQRAAAKKRQSQAGKDKAPGKFPEAQGQALDLIARISASP
jgi:hypothetical protein